MGTADMGHWRVTATRTLYSRLFLISTIFLFEKLICTTYFVVVVLQQPKATDLYCHVLAARPGARLGGVGVMPTPLHTPTLKELISSQHLRISMGRAEKTSSVPTPTIKEVY